MPASGKPKSAEMDMWVWRHIQFLLPPDWEMLQFSKGLDQGRCAFGDRYQIVLEFSWSLAQSSPDMDRTISDYQAKLSEAGMEDLRSMRVGAWRGIAGVREKEHSSRFLRYFPKENAVVQFVFLWPKTRDSQKESEILSSIRSLPAKDGLRRWTAFGMDFFVADGCELTQCNAQPANVKMVFESSANPEHREEFLRLGLLSDWMKGSPGDWLALNYGDKRRTTPSTSETLLGHTVYEIRLQKRRLRLKRLSSHKIGSVGRAWICPHDGRLYCQHHEDVERSSPRPVQRTLICCEGFRFKP